MKQVQFLQKHTNYQNRRSSAVLKSTITTAGRSHMATELMSVELMAKNISELMEDSVKLKPKNIVILLRYTHFQRLCSKCLDN